MSSNRGRQFFFEAQLFTVDSQAQPEQLRIEDAGDRCVEIAGLDYASLDSSKLYLAIRTGDCEALRSASVSVPEFFLRKVHRKLIVYSHQRRAAAVQLAGPGNAYRPCCFNKGVEFHRLKALVETGHFLWPEQVAAVMRCDSQALKGFLEPLSYRLDAEVVMENAQQVLSRDRSGKSQSLRRKISVYLLSCCNKFLQDVLGVFQGAIAAVADRQDVETRPFSQGQISGRREQVRLEVEVSKRISAAVELFYIYEFDSKLTNDLVGGSLIARKSHRCHAAAEQCYLHAFSVSQEINSSYLREMARFFSS